MRDRDRQPRSTTQAGRPAGHAARAAGPVSAGLWADAAAQLVDAVATAVVVCGPRGVLDINERACRLLGLDRATVRGARTLLPRRWAGSIRDERGRDVPPGDWPPGVLDPGDARSSSGVYAVRSPDRQDATWLQVSAERLRGDDALETVVVTLDDLTELREARRAAESAESELATLLQAVPDTFVHLDADDRIVRVVGERWPGGRDRRAPGASVVGRQPWELFDGEASGMERQAVALARATDRPVTTELVHDAHGERRVDEARHAPLAGGGMLVMLREITERKRTEEALQRSEEKYRTLYTRTPVMLHSIDVQGRLLSVSDRWLERLGYTAGEVIGRLSTEFLTEESRRFATEDVLPAFFRTGSCTDVPYQMLTKKGDVVDVLLSATAERDAAGGVVRSLAVLVDVTAQRAAESEVARQERALHAVVDQAPILLWTVGEDLAVTSVRGGALGVAGVAPGELVGHPLTRLAAGRGGDALVAAARAALTGRPAAFEHGIGGRSYEGQLHPLTDPHGDVTGAVGVSFDVTEARAAQDALEERERMLSTLFHNLPGMAYRRANDDAWTMWFVSDGCAELVERAPEDLIGNAAVSYAELIHPDDGAAVRRAIEEALGHREHWTLTYRIVMPDGRVKWVWERGSAVRDDDGGILHLEGFITDVTERRQAEDTLRDREEMLSGLVGSLPGAAYRGEAQAPWRTHFISDGCREITGYGPEEFAEGRLSWADIMHPEDTREGAAIIARDLAAGAPATVSEYRIFRKDGAQRWLLDRAAIVRDQTGAPAEVIGLVIDITERRETEEALKDREAQLQGLMADIPGMAYRCEPQPPWQDVFIGAACHEMTGYTPQQLIAGRPVWEDIMEPADKDLLRLETQAAIDEHRPGELEYRIRTASGELRWIWDRFHILRDPSDVPVSLEGLMLDITDRRAAEEESRRLRLHDATTGLPNRFLFVDRIAQALAHAQRRRLGFAVTAMAVDRFSTLVETLGHEACDRLVVAAADRLTETMRTEDTVATLAGSEFGLLLAGVASPAQASTTLGKIVEAFSHPFQVDAHELFLTLSLGVSMYPSDGSEAQELLENAEVAARRVSSEGGNGWQFFRRGTNDERAGRLVLEGELHRALARDQFLLHYQPVVDARDGEIVAFEALLRWQRPENGIVPPGAFLDVAEETGLMVPIGAWALRRACAQAQAWSTELGKPLRMAVNLSARQLYAESLVPAVVEALEASGLPAGQLELEITETAAMSDPERAGRVVRALRGAGVGIALDDFGTGYSSLSHLVQLPIATVKIDRSFVSDLLSVPEHAAVVASVIALGHRLGLTVVAEGVETPEELAFLRAEGCDELQGFLMSRPVPPDECGALLRGGPLLAGG